MKILVINGPNLNMLGKREPEVYGKKGFEELCESIKQYAEAKDAAISFKQSNAEGELINFIQEATGIYNGIIINPGAFTHYSYAIADALLSAGLPAVEVHISNIHKREEFRHTSVTASACAGQICGFGLSGYKMAVDYLVEISSAGGDN